MKRILPFFTILLIAPSVAAPQNTSPVAGRSSRLHRIDAKTPQGLQELFKHTGEPLPFVSAHRGGATKGFPENCMAAFEKTLRCTFSAVEVDPRYTKDGVIVVHHDAKLERTTTGQGLVAESTLQELKQLRLKDPVETDLPCQVGPLLYGTSAVPLSKGKVLSIR